MSKGVTKLKGTSMCEADLVQLVLTCLTDYQPFLFARLLFLWHLSHCFGIGLVKSILVLSINLALIFAKTTISLIKLDREVLYLDW